MHQSDKSTLSTFSLKAEPHIVNIKTLDVMNWKLANWQEGYS